MQEYLTTQAQINLSLSFYYTCRCLLFQVLVLDALYKALICPIRAFFNLVDLALSDTKKECYDVASVFKQLSEWCPDVGIGHQIRAGLNLTSQWLLLTSVRNGICNSPFLGGYFAPSNRAVLSNSAFGNRSGYVSTGKGSKKRMLTAL